MNLDFNILVFLTAFVFALPIIGYIFRFNIPISLFFFIAGVFMLSILLVTDGIILNDRIDNIVATESTFNITTSTISIPVYSYNVISSTASLAVDGSGVNPLSRIEFASSPSSALVGDIIECVNIPIARTSGLPPNNIPIEIGTLSGTGMIVKSFGTLNTTQVTTSFVWFEFCLPDGEAYTIQSGDRIGIRYSGGNVTNGLFIRNDGNNPFDSTTTFLQSYIVSWVSATSNDLTMQLYRYDEFPNDVQIAGIGGVYTYEDNIMDISFTGQNYQIKVILIFISIMFMVGGALVEAKSRR